MALVLGLDTSTTATKAVLVDEGGRVVGVAASEYGYDTPRPQWSEQDPDLWWVASQAAIQSALAGAGVTGDGVDAVGLTGQMHGLVVLDSNRQVLRPAILWNDQRTGAECDEIRDTVGLERLVRLTGNDALTGFTAPKLLWVRNHEPEVYERVATVLLPKDYVRLRLTDELALDRAGGAGTLLFNLGQRTWSDEMLSQLNLPPEWFPETFEGPEVTGTISASAAAATGLTEGTPVVAGGGDQAANAVGTGAINPGAVTLSLGTSGVVFAATDAPVVEPHGRVHAFCHAVPERWHFMGVMLSAAGSLRWFRDTFAPGVGFDEVDSWANGAPAGSDGLFFLPYLTGERTPHPDPDATGAFTGITVRHDRSHFARAVMEGVAFGLADGLQLMEEAGVTSVDQIRASGGGMNSALWRSILADVLGAEIATVNTAEGAAFGAATLAAVGAGWAATAGDLTRDWVTITSVTEPGSAAPGYHEAHARYQELYPALHPPS